MIIFISGCLPGKSQSVIDDDSDIPAYVEQRPYAKVQCAGFKISEKSIHPLENTPSNINCTLSLTKASTEDLEIRLDVEGSAVETSDFNPFSKSVIILKGSLSTQFQISAKDDGLYEPIEDLIIKILPDSSPQARYLPDLQFQSYSISLLDDEISQIAVFLTIEESILDEGNASHQIVWSLEFYDTNSGEPVTLPFEVKFNFTLEQNKINVKNRLNSNVQNIVIPQDTVRLDIPIGIINDNLKQELQSDIVHIMPDPQFVFSPYSSFSAELFLYDDDLPTVTLTASATSGTENNGTTTFQATINSALTTDLILPIVYSGSATKNSDYRGATSTPVPESLLIPAGSRVSQATTIRLVGDGFYEGSENVTISIPSNPTIYSLGTENVINILIVDDVNPTPDFRSIELTATPQSNPVAIILNLIGESGGSEFKVYRKLMSDKNFPAQPIATLSPGVMTYTDNTISSGIKYEYQVIRADGIAYGFIVTGVNLAPIHDRGGILLVIENSLNSTLSFELGRLTQDLIEEGWVVSQLSVLKTDSVISVKSRINEAVSASNGKINSLFLLGRVPVPYSGGFAPDGHTDHIGAWPADMFYADLDTENKWTDLLTGSTNSSRLENRNLPGDNKFDQSFAPQEIKLQIGRVDLANMPAFLPLTEVDLLRRYLNKNHQYRKKIVDVPRRALIDDNWGTYGGGDFFATSIWRSISTIVGKSNIRANANSGASDWFTQLRTNNYLFAYGGGSGTYTSVNGIGTTQDFNSGPSQAVFCSLFGSYLGDWDSTNNVLRAPLAAEGLGLTSVWSGRPGWYFHHMAAGETIGYSTRLSQNNSTTYPFNVFQNGVHMALMGDPTLTAYIVKPASQLNAQILNSKLNLTWQASTDSGLTGYYIYSSPNPQGPFTLISTPIVTENSFETSAPTGTLFYRVRAAKKEMTPSGEFINLSPGIDIQFDP
jgi:hypothetical protein